MGWRWKQEWSFPGGIAVRRHINCSLYNNNSFLFVVTRWLYLIIFIVHSQGRYSTENEAQESPCLLTLFTPYGKKYFSHCVLYQSRNATTSKWGLSKKLNFLHSHISLIRTIKFLLLGGLSDCEWTAYLYGWKAGRQARYSYSLHLSLAFVARLKLILWGNLCGGCLAIQ
jgi:hypothetical protein